MARRIRKVTPTTTDVQIDRMGLGPTEIGYMESILLYHIRRLEPIRTGALRAGIHGQGQSRWVIRDIYG